MAQILCPRDQWTQVMWTAGPFSYTSKLRLLVGFGFPFTVKVRRNSGGPPWHWEGVITSNAPMYFWHSPVDYYASIDVCPVGTAVTVEALPTS